MFAQSKGRNYSLTNNGASGVADAIDFDGTTDYLSRNADLVGNTDGKTFTFSVWVWADANASYEFYNTGGGRFSVSLGGNGTVNTLFVRGKNAANTLILDVTVSLQVPSLTFCNVIVSVDLTNTSNRSIYINDVLQPATWATYKNDNIDFTSADHNVAAGTTASNKLKGRLSHLYLDYQYRDLSVEANRRIFVLP